jgi:hypothetical protein
MNAIDRQARELGDSLDLTLEIRIGLLASLGRKVEQKGPHSISLEAEEELLVDGLDAAVEVGDNLLVALLGTRIKVDVKDGSRPARWRARDSRLQQHGRADQLECRDHGAQR